MRLLDLFCGAGGASEGYVRAGFEVVGVDIEPQPNYRLEFIQGDALSEAIPPAYTECIGLKLAQHLAAAA